MKNETEIKKKKFDETNIKHNFYHSIINLFFIINQSSLKYFNILFFLFHLYSVDFFTFKFFINCLYTTILLSYTYN